MLFHRVIINYIISYLYQIFTTFYLAELSVPTFQKVVDSAPFAGVKRVQFFQTEKRDVVLRRVDDRPLVLLNVNVQCCPLGPGINMTLARSDTRAIR